MVSLTKTACAPCIDVVLVPVLRLAEADAGVALGGRGAGEGEDGLLERVGQCASTPAVRAGALEEARVLEGGPACVQEAGADVCLRGPALEGEADLGELRAARGHGQEGLGEEVRDHLGRVGRGLVEGAREEHDAPGPLDAPGEEMLGGLGAGGAGRDLDVAGLAQVQPRGVGVGGGGVRVGHVGEEGGVVAAGVGEAGREPGAGAGGVERGGREEHGVGELGPEAEGADALDEALQAPEARVEGAGGDGEVVVARVGARRAEGRGREPQAPLAAQELEAGRGNAPASLEVV